MIREPVIGSIVNFRLTSEQAEKVMQRRELARVGALFAPGLQAVFSGNTVAEGSVVPLVVTAVWLEEYQGTAHLHHHRVPFETGSSYQSSVGVNGQALMDGTDSLWVCSAPQHETLAGCWFWPKPETVTP